MKKHVLGSITTKNNNKTKLLHTVWLIIIIQHMMIDPDQLV